MIYDTSIISYKTFKSDHFIFSEISSIIQYKEDNKITIILKNKILPNKYIDKYKQFFLMKIKNKYKKFFSIEQVHIFIKDMKSLTIERVFINAHHANAHPETKELCLPYNIKYQTLDEELFHSILLLLYRWDIGNCYYNPTKYIESESIKPYTTKPVSI